MRARALATLTAIVLYGFAPPLPVVRDLHGRQVSPIGQGISVLLFTRTDCPISNRYAPEVARLYERFHSAGVTFWLVYVDRTQNDQVTRAHMLAYKYPFGGVNDDRHSLVKFAGAKTTPEAAVYSAGRLVYRGRIDNRYSSPGVSRPAATIHDLEDTLTAVGNGQMPAFRTEPATGCFIEDLR